MIRNPYRQLEKALGYRFRKRAFLLAAVTHRSFRYEKEDVEHDNQRLEFLGDAALGLVAAAHLYETHPGLQEGDLTRLRSKISSRQALVRVARELDLGSFLRLGKGERLSGGHVRPSNMADALEAILGAAYLDGKLKAVEKIYLKLFLPLLEQSEQEPWRDNPKGALQELCQQRWKSSPKYRLVAEKGPAHSRHFSVEVTLNGKAFGRGHGPNKRAAEMKAAQEALQKLHADTAD